MVSYFCFRCGKFFYHKGTFKRHLFREKICPAVVSKRDRLEIWDYYELNTIENSRKLTDFNMVIEQRKSATNKNGKTHQNKNSSMNQVKNISDQVETINENGKVKFICNYCGGQYTRKNNLNYHIKHFCKGTEQKKGEKISSKKSDKSTEKILELEKRIDEISKTSKVVNNFNNLTNNVQTINNQINNNYYQVNTYGKEKDIEISEDFLVKVIKNPIKGIPDLISMHHFNPEKPENHNVRYNGKRSSHLDIYNGEFWEAKDKGEVIHDMIVSKKDIADDFFDEAVENKKVENKVIDNYNLFSEKIDRYVNAILSELNYEAELIEQDKDLYKQLYKQVELMMINAQRILRLKSKNLPSPFSSIDDM